MDTRDDEKERGITIKSTAISMYFPMEKDALESIAQKKDGMRVLDQPHRLARSRRLLLRSYRRPPCH